MNRMESCSTPRHLGDASAVHAESDDIPRPHARSITGLICILLAAITWIAFGQSIHHDFLDYDDNEYVYDNAQITRGLSLAGVGWAFTHIHAANWHPLTTISHMLDVQLHGLQPWGHHLTNILLHALAAILLFFALRRLTGPSEAIDSGHTFWASAFVAALFAIHPLRVESVAWISERKDVLSGVLFMLTLWAYAVHARTPREDRHRLWRNLSVVALFALGLLSKPTLVTLPFVLLLLDYWPLGRFQKSQVNSQASGVCRLVIEKIPLVVLSGASCVVTILAQKRALVENLSLSSRASNAAASYLTYIGQMLWPRHLTVFYPYPERGQSALAVILALTALLIVSAIFFAWRKKYPFLLVGWLWFLGMLVPMIGLVQVGLQSHADRYTYLPMIGLYIALTWGSIELFGRAHFGRIVASILGAAVIAALTARSYFQTLTWRNLETVMRHAIDCNPRNYVAYNNLANLSVGNGRLDDAVLQLEKALQLKPDYLEAEYNLGNVFLRKGDLTQAIVHLQKALAIRPQYWEAQNNLASAYAAEGRYDEAIKICQAAVRNHPNYAEPYNNLGCYLSQVGRFEEALVQLQEAVRIDNGYPEAHYNLGALLAHLGRRDEAVAQLNEALRLKPDYEDPRRQLRQLGIPVSQ